METSTIVPTPAIATREPSSRGFNDLSGQDFFALLIAELQSQDPLKPMDNQQFVEQMSSIRQMEQSTVLNDTLRALAAEQRFGATAGLIGHYVSGTVSNEAGTSYLVQGVVVGVRYESDGRAILELHDGRLLPADKVQQVTLVENLPAEILQELQRELDMLDGEEDQQDGAPTARLAVKDLATAARLRAANAYSRPPTAAELIRGSGQQASNAADLLSGLFSPRVGIGF
jgi:flagellar basal-body rod modification protein FlgD